MHRPDSHQSHTEHPMHSGPRTAAGLLVFVLVVGLVLATLLHPPVGLAVVAVAAAVAVGRHRHRLTGDSGRRPATDASSHEPASRAD
jgi:hypothetical protein